MLEEYKEINFNYAVSLSTALVNLPGKKNRILTFLNFIY